jgi:hypothetical protein
MTNRFMMSVAAAALIAGTGFAYAQGTGTSRESPSMGSTAQQSAPSSAPSSATPMNRDSSDKGGPAAKTTQSDEKAAQPGGAKNQRAQDDMKAGQKSEKSAQEKSAQDNMKGEKSKSMSSENDKAKGGSKEMKAEGREDRSGMKAEQKGAAESRSQTTIGQAGAGAKLSTEQRTKITTVIRDQHVAPVNNVNFQIVVGTRVPRDVTFHPLPVEVVTIYPEWRGYQFILVRNQIVVVDPRTFEIVAILEA